MKKNNVHKLHKTIGTMEIGIGCTDLGERENDMKNQITVTMLECITSINNKHLKDLTYRDINALDRQLERLNDLVEDQE